MKLSKRERFLLIFVIILALGVVYYFYCLNPFMNEMKEIKNDIQSKELQLQTLKTQDSALQVLDKQIADLKQQNGDILKKIPTGFSQPELLYFLQKAVGENARKTSFNFELPVDLVKLDNTKATLSFFTDYTKLKKLLTALKESRFNNRILSLTVSTVQEKTEETTDESTTPEETEENTASSASDTETSGDTTNTKQLTASSVAALPVDKGNNLQAILVVEFFNLKGDALKSKPDWNTFNTGKTDLFK